MTLSDLKAYLVDRKRVSLAEIAIHFDTSQSAVRPMLDKWISKGRLRQVEAAGSCGKTGSSCSCCEKPAEVFEWTA